MQTEDWGVLVTLVELKDIQLPDTMKRAMARQAEAEREKRAKIIAAEGEALAAAALGDASDTMMAHPIALQLRNLQTLVEIGVDKNTTVVFPAPLMSTIGELGTFLRRETRATPARRRTGRRIPRATDGRADDDRRCSVIGRGRRSPATPRDQRDTARHHRRPSGTGAASLRTASATTKRAARPVSTCVGTTALERAKRLTVHERDVAEVDFDLDAGARSIDAQTSETN